MSASWSGGARAARFIRAGIVAANSAGIVPEHPLARRAYRRRMLALIAREAPQRRVRIARQYTRHAYAGG